MLEEQGAMVRSLKKKENENEMKSEVCSQHYNFSANCKALKGF